MQIFFIYFMSNQNYVFYKHLLLKILLNSSSIEDNPAANYNVTSSRNEDWENFKASLLLQMFRRKILHHNQ